MNLIGRSQSIECVCCVLKKTKQMFYQDKYKRALADTENLRRRSQKMVEDAKLFGEYVRQEQWQ